MTDFIKTHQGSLSVDWQRLTALKQVCEHVGDVLTPTPLRIDENNSAIIYERWEFPAPLISQINNACTYSRIGRTLAKMHMAPFNIEYSYFDGEPYPIQCFGLKTKDVEILETNIPTGWFHGDLWHGNVFLLPSDEIMVVDPIPIPAVFPETHIKASGAIDVAFMYMSIVFCLPLHKQLTININQHIASAESFMKGYLNEREVYCIEVEKSIRRMSRKLAEVFIQNYSKRIPQPLSSMKKMAALRILNLTDKKINWNK